MGSIVYIEKNPHKWRQIDEGLRLKSDPSESLVKIAYGDFDDDPLGSYDLEILMRRSILDKLLSGEYHVDPCCRNDLIILDRNGDPIPPIEPDAIY